MTKIAANTFNAGLDKDTDIAYVKAESYLHAENFRLFTDEGSTSGALSNVKGNIDFTENYIPSNQTIIGHCSIREDLYLFTKGESTVEFTGSISSPMPLGSGFTQFNASDIDNLNSGDRIEIVSSNPAYNGSFTVGQIIMDTPTDGRIWLQVNFAGSAVGNWTKMFAYDDRLYRITMDDTTSATPTVAAVKTIFMRTDLGFSINHPINAIGRYENENIQKIYWSDGVYPLRVLNVADFLPDGTENDSTYINNLPLDVLEIVPNSKLTDLKLLNIVGGSLKTGVIQYAYQLYSTYGNETTFSPPSQLIHLTRDNEFQGTNRTYAGWPEFIGDNEENGRINTGKGLELSIENIDPRFQRIRVVSIYYAQLYSVPQVNIVYEGSFSNNMVKFIDTGYSLGILTPEEVAMLGQLSLSPKTLETKDNRLFIGNVTEEYFNISDEEFDARAYRFKANGEGGVTRADGLNTVWINKNLPNWGVPLNHDANNTFNNLNNDFDPLQAFKYKSNGTTLGGEGPNISYTFTQAQIDIDTEPNVQQNNFNGVQKNTTYTIGSQSYLAKSYGDFASPWRSGLLRGYQRDEIYRFAIVFYDKKMRPSPAKWIGDIRFPTISDILVAGGGANGPTWAYSLGIVFEVNLPQSVKEKISGYQIVRCKREAEDRTVVASGLAGFAFRWSTGNNGTYGWPGRRVTGNIDHANNNYESSSTRPLAKDIIEFISPEVNFNKNITLLPGDFLRLEAAAQLKYTATLDESGGYSGSGNKFWKDKYRAVSNPTDLGGVKLIPRQDKPIENLQIFGITQRSNENIVSFNNRNFIHYSYELHGDNRGGHRGTTLVLGVSTANPFTIPGGFVTASNGISMYLTYRRKATQYGGNSYMVRSTNKYIPASNFIPLDYPSAFINVYGGDTFIGMYDYLRTTFDIAQGANKKIVHTISFPVETSINLTLRHDKHYNRLAVTDPNRWYLQETKELGLSYAASKDWYKFPDDYTSLYLYNSVYSRENDVKTFFAQPLDLQVITNFDVRVYNSEKKISGEASDSWTKFLANSFIDLDSKYGPLTKLINYRDKLIGFQPEGIALLSVNHQTVIQDITSTSLVLGDGGLLDRYDYITTTSGSKHDTSIISTPIGLYWFDANNKKVYRLGESDEPISDIKGMNSYFQENINGLIIDNNSWADLQGSHVCAAFDDKFMEILYSFKKGDDLENSFTLSYNAKADNFISFYSFVPQLYIEHSKKLLSSEDLNKLWLHDYGDYSSFYGSVFPSTLEMVINPDYAMTKVFDTIFYNSESWNDRINIYGDTFNIARLYNSYQNTDWFSLDYRDNIERRERTWSFHIPRDIVNEPIENQVDIFDPANLDSTRLFKARMRDKYSILNLVYSNSNNYKFTIPSILTKYRVSYR